MAPACTPVTSDSVGVRGGRMLGDDSIWPLAWAQVLVKMVLNCMEITEALGKSYGAILLWECDPIRIE